MCPRLAALALVAMAACCSKSEVKGGGGAAEVPPKPTLTVFALAELRGQIGPCGCTSDPLGDISRTVQMVAEARAKGPVLVLDAGSTLYSQNPVPPHLAAQEELKANLIERVYRDQLQVAAVGLGPADLAQGPGAVRFPRFAVNVPGDQIPTAGPEVFTIGGAKVGVFGVVARGAIALELDDPSAAGKRAVGELRANGAQVVIGLVQAPSKREAVALVRDIGGIDLAIAGLGALAPEPDQIEVEAERVGDGWLIVPANRGQVVSRVDLALRGGGAPLVDAIGPGAARARLDKLGRQLASLDAELAAFAQDAHADAAFVAQKRGERAQLAAQQHQLETRPLVAPKTGSYFTLEQLRIGKALGCSVAVQGAIKAYDTAAGEANVAAAAGKLPTPPAKGQAGYVGNEACSDCHDEAVEFWKTTRHAGAWKTLVDRGQQFDYECTSCHVTGWDQPGGSNLAFNEPLRDVGCETCHGPGSIHVAKGGEERPFAIVRAPAPELCATQCHTKEHSDTFDHAPYLRDVLGPGHGADARGMLGDGITGRELRQAALDKAGRSLGPGCTK
jgi:hypothetical protein